MTFRLNTTTQVHRGHAEAQKALQQWLSFIRCRKEAVEKDWQGCEKLDPQRLPLSERIDRGDAGDNVLKFPSDKNQPSLERLDQQSPQSFSYTVDHYDIKSLIEMVNAEVKRYFYAPATVITYSEFCQRIVQIKLEIDSVYTDGESVSPYERDQELAHCHYTFIYAGFGKLEGDIDTGKSPEESAASMASVVGLLSSMEQKMVAEKAPISIRNKVQAAISNAEKAHSSLLEKKNIPELTRPPGM